MTERPNINIKKYQTKKIGYGYLAKFLIYGTILLGLFFWYKYKKGKVKESEQVEIRNIRIEE
ncbi:MAG: hypothetical protein ACI9XP_001297 [Lentimonas sp.]|jgi:hypothetical protein